MNRQSRIFVAGHRGLVGSAIVRHLQSEGYDNLVTRPRSSLDLTDRIAVDRFFERERPEYVFDAAARVGGILANSTYPADFIRENLLIATNLIDASYRFKVRKNLLLGSSCIYPKHAPQPITEDALLSGPLEPTNIAYAVAKIAGIVTAQSYHRQFGMNAISLMPTNLYGPGDNFDLNSSHVLPALIRKFDDAVRSGADSVTVWGSGKPRREFLHVDDLARAAVLLMNSYDNPQIINVGTGEDVTILELAQLVASITGFQGTLEFDSSKPDGTPRKVLEVSRLRALGWTPRWTLEAGIRDTYDWYRSTQVAAAV
jgi:GDP-L-fucose synthase